jgi:hypothetical protein
MVVFGFVLSFYSISIWKENDFSNLEPTKILRFVIPAIVSLQLGIQIILFSLFFSILGLKNTSE